MIDPLTSSPSATTVNDSLAKSAAVSASSVDADAAASSTQSPITNADGTTLGAIREYLEQAVAEALESYDGEGSPRDVVQAAVQDTLAAHGFDFEEVKAARTEAGVGVAARYAEYADNAPPPADPEDPATAVAGFLSQLPPGSLAGNVA